MNCPWEDPMPKPPAIEVEGLPPFVSFCGANGEIPSGARNLCRNSRTQPPARQFKTTLATRLATAAASRRNVAEKKRTRLKPLPLRHGKPRRQGCQEALIPLLLNGLRPIVRAPRPASAQALLDCRGSRARCEHENPHLNGASHLPLLWRIAVRWIGWILVVLLAVSWLAVELPPLVASKPLNDQGLWRRTRSGWERADWLLPQPAPSPLGMHPANLALLQVIASVGGLCLARSQGSAQPVSPKRM